MQPVGEKLCIPEEDRKIKRSKRYHDFSVIPAVYHVRKMCSVCNIPDIHNVARRIFGDNRHYICSNKCIRDLFAYQYNEILRKKIYVEMQECGLID